MVYLSRKTLSNPFECPYIPGQKARYTFFHAHDVSATELDKLLNSGWRKFGYFFFRPHCPHCQKCIPIRVTTNEFKPSKSQRRVLKKTSSLSVIFTPLQYSDEIFDIYTDHSGRFDKTTDKDEFLDTFYTISCPSLQSEYYLDNKLVAVGFLDRSSGSLSSVYFIYRRSIEELSPGNFSIMKEIEQTRRMGLDHYYLGYYVAENHSMNYKNRFFPYELYDWNTKKWYQVTKPEKIS